LTPHWSRIRGTCMTGTEECNDNYFEDEAIDKVSSFPAPWGKNGAAYDY